jgi:hypothetical protein
MAGDSTKEQRCQDVFRTLHTMACGMTLKSSPCTFVRELAFTEEGGCDAFRDLSIIRRSHADLIGAPAMARIAEFKETVEDERRAAQAVFRHRVEFCSRSS